MQNAQSWLGLLFFLFDFSSSDVQKALSQCKDLKSCRTDCLDGFVLKLSKAFPVTTALH